MIADRSTDFLQLVRKHFETLPISRHIRKILHASSRKIMLKGDSTRVLIILEDVRQAIPDLHSCGVRFQDGSEQIYGDSIVNPLEDGGVKSDPQSAFLQPGSNCSRQSPLCIEVLFISWSKFFPNSLV